SLDDIKNVIVKNSDGKIIHLGDIASVADTTKEQRSLSRFNGKDAVTIQITRQSGSNTVKVAETIKKSLLQIQKLLPQDIKVAVVQDNSTFIRESLADVQTTIIYGGLLAVLVIFLFLRNIPSTMISAIAIPTSIIASFTFMKMLGFTINFMSLIGLSLAVGLLIDDAIVVIENIYRHLARGETPWEAAKNGTSEIGLAVMATTFSIVVVFVPVAFMSGIMGRFFYQFGMTVAISVMVSLFVAFTLTPMLSSRFLSKEKHIEKGSKNPIKIILYYWNYAFEKFGDIYRVTLAWVLKHRAITLVGAFIGFAISMYLATFLGNEFIPAQDRAELFVNFKTASGSSLERASELANLLEQKIAAHKDIFRYQLLTIGGTYTPVNEGSIYVKIVDKDQRKQSVFDFGTTLRNEIASIPGIKTSVAFEGGHGDVGGQAVEYSVRGTDFDKLKALAARVESTIEKAPGAVDVENSEKQARPELRIAIDRQVASDLGLNLATIGTTIRSLVDGADISRFKDGDEEYDINVRLAPQYRTDIENINSIYVPSFKKIRGEDYSVPLHQVANIYQASAPTEIRRYDRQREIRVGSNLAAGFVMSDIMKQLEANREALKIPPGYIVVGVGESEIMQESFRSIFFALFLAIIFIYLLLASQFESFLDPFSMGMSLLMAPVGAIIALIVFRSPVSVMSLIGIVLLMGLVTKNAILLIDFIKQARARGMERTEAILQAGPIRLRPILMTSLAMIFAMLPLAFAIGPGAEMRAPMAQAVIGGLISSTLLTLIIVPIVYTLLDDLTARVTGKRKKTGKATGTGGATHTVNG
ncbi:MAG TPA: AcrB/AcrD/AcrF family protein, partial [candidate division Zixibacteria bacterium]|nr:AcrB/AcrD/AcrF family protein [candidate division Zixibacteria bacterium]